MGENHFNLLDKAVQKNKLEISKMCRILSLITIAVVLTAYFQYSEALKCYSCSVSDDRYVGDSRWDCRNSLVECPKDWICKKTTNNQVTTRSCVSSCTENVDSTNATQHTGSVFTTTTCCSNKDKCNSSNSLINNKFLIAVFLMIGAFLKL